MMSMRTNGVLRIAICLRGGITLNILEVVFMDCRRLSLLVDLALNIRSTPPAPAAKLTQGQHDADNSSEIAIEGSTFFVTQGQQNECSHRLGMQVGKDGKRVRIL